MTERLPEEIRYRLLRQLAQNPEASQRELAQQLGISLGKVNYCLRAVMARGWVKMQNFRRSRRKTAYVYVLTPRGVEEKVKVTAEFLRQKVAEYETVVGEIERLRREVEEGQEFTASGPPVR